MQQLLVVAADSAVTVYASVRVAMNIYHGRCASEFFLAIVLYDSIEDQDTSAVTSLICDKAANANFVLPREGIAPFHLAVGVDSEAFATATASLILRHGGDPNVRSHEGLTPLHVAACWGRMELVRLLLHCGADPQLEDRCYMTPAGYAAEEGHHEIARLLGEYVASQNAHAFDAITGGRAKCVRTLDKVLINNGQAIAEYNCATQDTDSIDLKVLPQANPNELVRNWCNTLELPSPKQPARPSTSSAASSGVLGKPLRYNNVTTKRPKSAWSSDSDEGIDECYRVFLSKHESGVRPLEASYSSPPAQVVVRGFCVSDSNGPSNRTASGSVAKSKDTSSDYFTCTTDASDIAVEPNGYEEVASSVGSVSVPRSEFNNAALSIDADASMVSVSEVYRYVDEDEKVVLFEKRALPPQKCPANDSDNFTVTTKSSTISTLPKSFDYDTDSLRNELSKFGMQAGPITATTKRVYLRKLHHLQRRSQQEVVQENTTNANKRVYSHELQKTLRHTDWSSDLTPYRLLEESVAKQFDSPNPRLKWREGSSKSSFTYLLLDPRKTQNLPCRAGTLGAAEQWDTFLSAVFYVGKGKRSRPYQHLYEAHQLHKQDVTTAGSKKLQRILDIWRDGLGVICLHVFLNVIPVEAYTREACMIHALRLDNLENVKGGEFYGVAATWSPQQKQMLGVYLLYKAMKIFFNEGERQLSPNDID